MVRLKEEHRPLIHDKYLSFRFSTVDSGRQGTHFQVLRYDGAKTTPSSVYTHPEHASFAKTNSVGIHDGSHVESIRTELNFSLTKECVHTDKIEELYVYVIPWAGAFKEKWTPEDEVSTLDIMEILELQKDDTNYEIYGLYNGTKMQGNVNTQNADEPGLTTNTNAEGITFDLEQLYDALRFYTNGRILSSIIGGIFRFKVKRGHSKRIVFTRNPSSTKHGNKYAGCGYLCYCPQLDDRFQIGNINDDTDSSTGVNVKMNTQMNEYNKMFHSDKN